MKVEGPEVWVVPWTYAALAEMAIEGGDMKAAKEHFSKAKKYVKVFFLILPFLLIRPFLFS